MTNIKDIRHVAHPKIDKQKWDKAILDSPNGKVYAQSVWLNKMSPNWNALILGDYEVVMPLSHKRKWGIKYLAQPAFTQQLGVFSNEILTKETYCRFIKKAQYLYKFGEISIYLPFNDTIENLTIVPRKNYLLDFSIGYDAIQANYSNDLLKKNLQRAKKFNLEYNATSSVENAVTTFKTLYADRTPHVVEKNYQQLLHLANEMLAKNKAFVREVRLPKTNELLACGLFFKDNNRIYNIASSTLPNGRMMEANHFLFDELIKEFAGTNLKLDFEGSDLIGVEKFYKKFGALLEPYFFIKWNHLPWLLKLFKH